MNWIIRVCGQQRWYHWRPVLGPCGATYTHVRSEARVFTDEDELLIRILRLNEKTKDLHEFEEL
jgi:hypothetical protein